MSCDIKGGLRTALNIFFHFKNIFSHFQLHIQKDMLPASIYKSSAIRVANFI